MKEHNSEGGVISKERTGSVDLAEEALLFVTERCILRLGTYTDSTTIYRVYKHWAGVRGQSKCMGYEALARLLEYMGVRIAQIDSRGETLIGLTVKSDGVKGLEVSGG